MRFNRKSVNRYFYFEKKSVLNRLLSFSRELPHFQSSPLGTLRIKNSSLGDKLG